jgi:hypothetical protein
MALDGYLAWPPACSNLPPLAEDPERVTFCQRLKAAVRGVLHGEQVRFRFYGFEEERLAFAEAFLVLMSLRGASPAYQGMALFVNDLVGGACQESGAAGACAEIEDLLAGLAADAEVRAEHRERCQAEAGDHATAGGCQQVIPEYVSGCLAVPEGPMEPREALRWLRRAFVCLGTAQPRVDAVSWWEVRGALAAMFESHVGPASIDPLTAAPEMMEVRLRMARLALLVGKYEEGAVPWLAYEGGGPYVTTSQRLLRLVVREERTVPEQEVAELLEDMQLRGVRLALVLAYLEMGIPTGDLTYRAVTQVHGWLSTLPAGLSARVGLCLVEDAALDLPIDMSAAAAAVLERLGAFELAEKALLAWVEDRPTPFSVYLAGLFYYRTGRVDEAVRLLSVAAREEQFARLRGMEERAARQAERQRLPAAWEKSQAEAQVPPIAIQKGQCTPYAVMRLAGYWEAPTQLSLEDAVRGTQWGEEGTDLLDAVAFLLANRWRLLTLKETDAGVDQVKAVLRSGLPVLAVMQAKECDGVWAPGASGGHTTLLVGFDDVLQAFLLDDMNWAAGVTQLAYHSFESGHVIPLVLIPPDRTLPEEVKALLVEPTLEEFITSAQAAVNQLRPVCLE